jgi:hypothetical protein
VGVGAWWVRPRDMGRDSVIRKQLFCSLFLLRHFNVTFIECSCRPDITRSASSFYFYSQLASSCQDINSYHPYSRQPASRRSSLSQLYSGSHPHSEVDNHYGYERHCNSSPISTSSSHSMSIASMATTPITPDSGVSFNRMDFSVQGQGLCDWNHAIVPVPAASPIQGQTQLRTLRLASEYDFDTGTGMDMDTALDRSRVLLRNDQDPSISNLSLGTEPQQDDMNLRLMEMMERTEGLAVVSPVGEEVNMERVEDYFDRDE